MRFLCIAKRFQATAKQTSASVSQAPTKLRRFWKDTSVQELGPDIGYQILLDNRTLKTAGGVPVLIPPKRKALALLTAAEWESQGEYLKSYSLPLVWTFKLDVNRDARC